MNFIYNAIVFLQFTEKKLNDRIGGNHELLENYYFHS
jgi:hypothetical protein